MTTRPLSVFITDSQAEAGGEVRYVATLAKALQESGHQVLIGCTVDSVLAERARAMKVSVCNEFHWRRGLRPRMWPHDLAVMRRIFETNRFDIVHVNRSQDHWNAAIVNRWMGRPFCLVRTRHNTHLVSNSWPHRVLNRDWTDFHIMVCRFMRDLFLRQRQAMFDESRVVAVHNGIDAETYRPDPKLRVEARREFGYSDDDIVLGIAARLAPIKGHAFILRAMALLKQELPNLRLLILGPGGLENELRGMSQDLEIANAVTFAGSREDVQRCTQAFDIGVQPSLAEASPFSLKEQMAAEKAVITSDYPACLETVDDGVEGFTVPAGTVEPLAAAIKQLARDPALRERMGRAGRERVLQEFNVQEFCRRTVDAYHRAIELHKEARVRP